MSRVNIRQKQKKKERKKEKKRKKEGRRKQHTKGESNKERGEQSMIITEVSRKSM